MTLSPAHRPEAARRMSTSKSTPKSKYHRVDPDAPPPHPHFRTLPSPTRARLATLAWDARVQGHRAAYRRHMRALAKLRRAAHRLPTATSADRLAERTWLAPTESAVRAAHRTLVTWMWRARAAGRPDRRAGYLAAYQRVAAQLHAQDWLTAPEVLALRARNLTQPSAQYVREVEQLVAAQASPARTALREQQQQRNRERFEANVLATALWALHHGDRDWTPLPVKDSDSTVAPGDEPTTGRLPGPGYLVVTVPPNPYGSPARLELYRADYDALLSLWGYDRVAQASRLREQLRTTSKGSTLTALYDLACASAAHPNLALSWHGYVNGGRLGDVFITHAASGGMQLSPNRTGDLREALMEVYRQCRVVAY